MTLPEQGARGNAASSLSSRLKFKMEIPSRDLQALLWNLIKQGGIYMITIGLMVILVGVIIVAIGANKK